MEIEEIRNLIQKGKIYWTKHAEFRFAERHILQEDGKHCVMTGEIIATYPEETPPCCLFLGSDLQQNPLHVLVSVKEGNVVFITGYRPSEKIWKKDFKTRKELL